MVMRFSPDEDNTRAFRDALGRFATGVTVITAPSPTGGIGMTANSFSSVSLDPALVLWAPSKTSLRYPFFETATHFAIHVMGEDQKDIAMRFAKQGDAFEGLSVHLSDNGVPLIDTCLARFECTTSALHDAGDHAIMVGQVEQVMLKTGSPLVFANGQFGSFHPET